MWARGGVPTLPGWTSTIWWPGQWLWLRVGPGLSCSLGPWSCIKSGLLTGEHLGLEDMEHSHRVQRQVRLSSCRVGPSSECRIGSGTLTMLSEDDRRMLSLRWRRGTLALSRRELARLRPLESSAPLFLPHRSLVGKEREGTRGGVTFWKESYPRAQRGETESLAMRAVSRCAQLQRGIFPSMTHTQRARLTMTAWHLQQLSAARGPIRLLRRFNGESRRQRRVSEEEYSSLKRSNLRCGGEAINYLGEQFGHF